LVFHVAMLGIKRTNEFFCDGGNEREPASVTHDQGAGHAAGATTHPDVAAPAGARGSAATVSVAAGTAAVSSPAPRLAPRRLLYWPPMAKICHVCAKGPVYGNSRSHSMVATRRRFEPNLQRVRIDDAGTPRRVYVCTRCLKAGKVTKAR
jgi:large subunit ribosomal protein L28